MFVSKSISIFLYSIIQFFLSCFDANYPIFSSCKLHSHFILYLRNKKVKQNVLEMLQTGLIQWFPVTLISSQSCLPFFQNFSHASSNWCKYFSVAGPLANWWNTRWACCSWKYKTSGKELYIDLIFVHEKFISTENKIIKLDVHMSMYHSPGKLGDVVVVIVW